MATNKFVTAAVQLCSRGDILQNLAVCKRLAEQAANQGASLLVLPECFAFLGRAQPEQFDVAESLDSNPPGRVLASIQEMARANGLWVIAGGMPEIPEKDKGAPVVSSIYNTSVTVSPAGEVVAVYRKMHLFDIDIPGRTVLTESKHTRPGREIVVASTDLGRIGLSICYDLRFPELYRELVIRMGAQILVVTAAFTAHTGAAHWHTLLRARAIENQCYVIAAAQTGQHNEKRQSYGHSLIIDPWGTILAEIPDDEGLAIAEIDLEALAERRRQMPCLQHQVLLR